MDTERSPTASERSVTARSVKESVQERATASRASRASKTSRTARTGRSSRTKSTKSKGKAGSNTESSCMKFAILDC